MANTIDIASPGSDTADLEDSLNTLTGLDFGWPAGAYRSSAFVVGLSSGAPSVNALETAVPFYVPRRTTVVALALALVTLQAGAEARVGLYADNNGFPGSLLVDAGIIDLSAGSASLRETAAISTTLPPGVLWTVCQLKNVATQATLMRSNQTLPIIPPTSATVLSGNNPRCLSRAITYGSALLSTASGSLAASTGTDAPLVLLKAAP